MKAKDYAKQFNDNPKIETLTEICNSFVSECSELLISRHAQSDSAAIAVFKEQEQKWRAFANLVPGIKRDGFRLLVRDEFPAIYEVVGWGNLTQRAADCCPRCGSNDWRDAIVPDTLEICNVCGNSR